MSISLVVQGPSSLSVVVTAASIVYSHHPLHCPSRLHEGPPFFLVSPACRIARGALVERLIPSLWELHGKQGPAAGRMGSYKRTVAIDRVRQSGSSVMLNNMIHSDGSMMTILQSAQ